MADLKSFETLELLMKRVKHVNQAIHRVELELSTLETEIKTLLDSFDPMTGQEFRRFTQANILRSASRSLAHSARIVDGRQKPMEFALDDAIQCAERYCLRMYGLRLPPGVEKRIRDTVHRYYPTEKPPKRPKQ